MPHLSSPTLQLARGSVVIRPRRFCNSTLSVDRRAPWRWALGQELVAMARLGPTTMKMTMNQTATTATTSVRRLPAVAQALAAGEDAVEGRDEDEDEDEDVDVDVDEDEDVDEDVDEVEEKGAENDEGSNEDFEIEVASDGEEYPDGPVANDVGEEDSTYRSRGMTFNEELGEFVLDEESTDDLSDVPKANEWEKLTHGT
ncbi:hypothetical protein THAOC_16386 [Thalassiosira oceanica]|uniref:Uncharacterized protein n=1 Tax=Thalassiosira oceanica TaxID=159749 RepID=K0S9Y2_THAOC|nr:hypothetical protein THAOC_16386 [Thalassiosira oceanica]|eukprot:EJK62983.1 hypothetical protein THAOC_16386 [Thalassiosira oceanica]